MTVRDSAVAEFARIPWGPVASAFWRMPLRRNSCRITHAHIVFQFFSTASAANVALKSESLWEGHAMPADSERVQSVFLAAVEAADPAARAEVLNRECGADA